MSPNTNLMMYELPFKWLCVQRCIDPQGDNVGSTCWRFTFPQRYGLNHGLDEYGLQRVCELNFLIRKVRKKNDREQKILLYLSISTEWWQSVLNPQPHCGGVSLTSKTFRIRVMKRVHTLKSKCQFLAE
jgi:hypothetical protein